MRKRLGLRYFYVYISFAFKLLFYSVCVKRLTHKFSSFRSHCSLYFTLIVIHDVETKKGNACGLLGVNVAKAATVNNKYLHADH